MEWHNKTCFEDIRLRCIPCSQSKQICSQLFSHFFFCERGLKTEKMYDIFHSAVLPLSLRPPPLLHTIKLHTDCVSASLPITFQYSVKFSFPVSTNRIQSRQPAQFTIFMCKTRFSHFHCGFQIKFSLQIKSRMCALQLVD